MAQSTVGKDFWVTFLPNYEHVAWNNINNTLELIVTGKRPCSGRVTNPNTHWSTTFEVQSGLSTTVSIPMEGNYQNGSISFEDDSDCILNQGLHIVTTDSVSLYAYNKLDSHYIFCGEATCVLPTQSLGDTYSIQAYPSYQSETDLSEFSIIAVENNTVVDINLTEQTANGHEPNTPFSVTLQAGQCYQILSASSYVIRRDFSGTHIKARNGKRIAVFAGNNNAKVNGCYNHLYEQMMPVSSWGQQFVVTGTDGLVPTKNFVRITALNNFCEIKRNGVPVDTIHARQTYEYEMTSSIPADFVETSEPAQVYLYFTPSAGANSHAPAMVVISPLEQRIKDVTFCTFNATNENQNHYVNIVTETDLVSSMKLDGGSISSQFHPVPYNNGFSYARIQIQHGTHILSNDSGGMNEGGFIAHVFGMGEADNSYAYSTGCMVVSLTSQIMVENHYSTGFANGFWYCEDATVNFSLFTNFEVSHADWRFGDNTTGTGTEIAHQYPQAGNYNVSCDVYMLSSQGQDSLMSTLTTKIHIQQPTEQDLYTSECDSYTWNGETYTESGIYTYHGHSIGGCDSIVNMHLTLHPTLTMHYDTTICNQYEWHDSIYTRSGIYTHLEGQTSFGCDSIAELHLTIEQTTPIQILGMTQLYYASDIWPGVYYYYVTDSTAANYGRIQWECSNPDWILSPKSDYCCMIIVNAPGSGILSATTTDGCITTTSIQLQANGLGFDKSIDNGIILYPNPAQTIVNLTVPQLRHVTIYSSMGQKVKDIAAIRSDSLCIDISELKQGIYFVEIITSLGKAARQLSILR